MLSMLVGGVLNVNGNSGPMYQGRCRCTRQLQGRMRGRLGDVGDAGASVVAWHSTVASRDSRIATRPTSE